MPIIQPHGRNLPDGRQVAEALQALWREQGARFLRTGEVESIRPTEQEEAKLQAIFEALLGPLWRQAWLEALYRVRLAEMQGGRERLPVLRAYGGIIEISVRPIVKELHSFAVSFDIYNEEITYFLERQVFAFLSSVNDTTSELLRTALYVGEVEGWTLQEKTRAIQEIFVNPQRSFNIAATEASRATHAGQYEAEKKTGLCDRKKLIVSSDACPVCLKAAARGRIPFDAPFVIAGKGYYADPQFPPIHCHCFCSYTGVLAKSQPDE
jgi:hypothetical protein